MQSVQCWPSDADLRTLVFRSSGQFIYAATVLKFVDDRYNRPTDRLNIILGTSPQKSSTAFADLDALYSQILSSSSHTSKTLRVLGALIAIRMGDMFNEFLDHFSMFVEGLLFLQHGDLSLALSGLHSLLQVPDPLDPETAPTWVVPFHRSFNDYLLDRLRSKEFFVNLSAAHADLTRCCLRALTDVYREGFRCRFDGGTSKEVLVYATRTWYFHCLNANPDRELLEALEAFNVVGWVDMYPGIPDPGGAIEPLDELAKVMQWLSSNPSSATQSVFQKYSASLDTYFTESLDKCTPPDKVPLLLGVLVFNSISPYEARTFLELTSSDMPGLLGPLIAIISSEYLYCNPLFYDFLIDPTRSGKYLVDSSTHTRVVIRYLEYIIAKASSSGYSDTFLLALKTWISHLPLACHTAELPGYLRTMPLIASVQPSVSSLITMGNIKVVLDWLKEVDPPPRDVISRWQDLQDTVVL